MELLQINVTDHFNKLNKLLESNNLLKINKLLESNNDVFYIYTTGIGDWTSTNVINIWKKCRFRHIMSLIPYKFKMIIIEHYDPFINPDNEKYSNDKTKTILEKIDEVLKKQDLETSNKETKTEQSFIHNFFNYENIDKSRPYIILDFANIFNYNYNYITKEYYINTEKNENLNCVYIPYPEQNNCNNIKENIKYFEYNSKNNTIKTYIELFLKNLTFDIYKNNDLNSNNKVQFTQYGFIEDILDKYLYKQVDDYIKKKHIEGSQNRLKLMDTIQEDYKDKIFKEFYEKLFEEDINSEQLFNLSNYNIFNDIIINIINNWSMI